jgi:hypothetical protein
MIHPVFASKGNLLLTLALGAMSLIMKVKG